MNIRTAKRWTKEESDRCLQMHEAGKSLNVIGHLLDRTPRAIEAHLREKRGVTFRHGVTGKINAGGGRDVAYVPPVSRKLSPSQLADRDHAYGSNRTLNQTYLGDPLPGRSALERMNRGGRV